MAMLDIHPSVARKALGSIFTSQPVMLAKINDMRDSLAVIFYALMKNEKLTTAGNNVEADHEVLRLSAAVEDLEKKFLIPIEHHNVSTSSVIAGGKKTKQMYYMMDEDVIRALQTEPDTVFRKQEKELAVSEWQRKSKQTKKLINQHGGLTGALVMLTRSGYEAKSLSDEKLAELEVKFRCILDELDAAS